MKFLKIITFVILICLIASFEVFAQCPGFGPGFSVGSGIGSTVNHITIQSAALGKGGTAPSSVIVGNYTGWSYDIGDDSIFNIDLTHDVDTSQNVYLHITWHINEAYATNSGEIQWRTAWSACPKDNTEAIDACTDSGTVDTADIDIPATAKYSLHTSTLTLTPSDISDLDSIGITLSRVAIDDGSNPVADPVITEVHLEYTSIYD